MACTSPLQAHRTESGGVLMGRAPPRRETVLLPCGGCIGCRTAKAKEWALRCHLELQKHETASFSTLTYKPQWLPPTLQKRDVQLWLKRLREAQPAKIRFFLSGEYGETTHRAHYHALLYGIAPDQEKMIEDTWRLGHVKTVRLTPQAIAYVAGYTAKKLGDRLQAREERVDPETGECYQWQPPFIQMSRKPGIGGHAREHASSWRSYAILNGAKMAVPRFLHEAWKQQASEEQIAQNALERKNRQEQIATTFQMLEAQEKINEAKQAMKADKRKL